MISRIRSCAAPPPIPAEGQNRSRRFPNTHRVSLNISQSPDPVRRVSCGSAAGAAGRMASANNSPARSRIPTSAALPGLDLYLGHIEGRLAHPIRAERLGTRVEPTIRSGVMGKGKGVRKLVGSSPIAPGRCVPIDRTIVHLRPQATRSGPLRWKMFQSMQERYIEICKVSRWSRPTGQGAYIIWYILLQIALVMVARVYSYLKTLFVERLSCARAVLAVHQRRRIRIVRILITVSPLMYRESLALAIHRSRPDFEVLLGAPESLDGQEESFRPHLLVRNDTDGAHMELLTGLCAGSRFSTATACTPESAWMARSGRSRTSA